jgi:hypothetical protein
MDEDATVADEAADDEAAGASGAITSLSVEPVGGTLFINQAYPIASRLACAQTPRKRHAPHRRHIGTLPTFGESIARSSSSPDAARDRRMVKGRLLCCRKVCEEHHASHSLFSRRTVGRHRRGFRSKHAAAYPRRGESLPRPRAPRCKDVLSDESFRGFFLSHRRTARPNGALRRPCSRNKLKTQSALPSARTRPTIPAITLRRCARRGDMVGKSRFEFCAAEFYL